MAFHVAQIQEAQAKTPVALFVRQPNQQVCNQGVLKRQTSIAGDADAEDCTGQFDDDST